MDATPEEATGGPPVAVLLVDDEENVLKALRRLLIDEECEVLTATSGPQGLEILKEKGNVGVIISDQRMPEMTGVEFLEQARRVAPYAMKIMLTGYADVHATADAINKGRAHRYMTKPWDEEEILEVVRSAVETYRQILMNRRQEEADREEQKSLQEMNLKLQKLVRQQQEELKEREARLEALPVERPSAGPQLLSRALLPMVDLLEGRRGMDRAHGRYVANIATELCSEMGLASDEMKSITLASLLHDIGKISLPDGLLARRTDEMTEEEFLEYQLHPIRAQRAIDGMEGMNGVGILVRHHHEAFDGSGFPDRLKGEGIPLGSRIMTLADYVSRFVEFFKAEKEAERLLSKVESLLGTQFDPALFPYLQNLVRDSSVRVSLTRPRCVQEVALGDLAVGMELAMDIRTKTGTLLLKRGTNLNFGAVQALEQHYRDKTSNGVVLVHAKEDT